MPAGVEAETQRRNEEQLRKKQQDGFREIAWPEPMPGMSSQIQDADRKWLMKKRVASPQRSTICTYRCLRASAAGQIAGVPSRNGCGHRRRPAREVQAEHPRGLRPRRRLDLVSQPNLIGFPGSLQPDDIYWGGTNFKCYKSAGVATTID